MLVFIFLWVLYFSRFNNEAKAEGEKKCGEFKGARIWNDKCHSSLFCCSSSTLCYCSSQNISNFLESKPWLILITDFLGKRIGEVYEWVLIIGWKTPCKCKMKLFQKWLDTHNKWVNKWLSEQCGYRQRAATLGSMYSLREYYKGHKLSFLV